MDSTIVNIGQTFTIENAQDILAKYKAAVDQNNSIKIVSEEIETIDLTGIQFIYSIKHESIRGINTEINLTFSDSAKELITKCGFAAII